MRRAASRCTLLLLALAAAPCAPCAPWLSAQAPIPAAAPDPAPGVNLAALFRIGGQATMTSDLYHSSGIDARRPGSAWRMNLTPQATLFGGVTMNFDILLSSEESHFRQNLNQLGVNPTWGWGGVHLGDFSRDYSPYIVQGSRVRGAGLDLHPGIVRFSVQGGRLQRMAAGALDGPVYRRNMVAASAGVGREMGTHLNLSVISVRDDLGVEDLVARDTILIDTIHVDLRPQIESRPQENLAVGIGGQLVLLKRILTLSGNAATSLFTRDLTADSIDFSRDDLPIAPGVVDRITDRHAPRLSSSVDYAYQMAGTFALRALRLRGGYERVGPGYSSLGLPYLINDRQSYHVDGLTRLWNGRLALQGQYRTQTNNLLGHKLNTVDRNTANASVSARLSDAVTTTLTGLVTTLANDAPGDSARLDTRSYAVTANTAVQRELFGRASVLSVGYNLQRTDDGNILAPVPNVTSHNLTGSVQLSLTPTISVAPSISGALTRGEGMESRENVFFGFAGNARFFDGNLRTSANLSHTTSQGRQISGTQFRASYPLGWGTDFAVQARHTRYGAFGDRPGVPGIVRHDLNLAELLTIAAAGHTTRTAAPLRYRVHRHAMIRRPVHALLSALALALAATAMSLMLATCEHYPSDLDELEAPSLTGFAVTPDSVDVTHDPGLVTASVSVRSPGGADSAVVVVASPSGAETLACVARAPAGGSRENGRWECAVTFAPGHETGVWHAARVEVHSAGGEVLRLLGADLRTADLNTGVRVAMSLPPTVGITAPGEGASFIAGDAVRFEGQGISFLGAALAGSALVWTSSIDGEIGTGTSFTTSGLSEGTHTITLTGTDARGLSGTAAVRVVVDERIVVATIQVTPEAATLSKLGESVRFTARAFDGAGRAIPDVAFEWASLDPTVATVDAAGVATARGRGTALIRARAADVVGVASLTVDAPPSVGIIAPINNASFVEGDEIHFEGWATRMDGEVLADSALRWVSDRDGAIGTGRSLRAMLSLGSHAITLTATTEYGLSSTAHSRIRVEEPRTGVASIRIDPAAAGVTGTEATRRFTARAFDSAEREMLDVVFEWSSDHPRVATVDANGLVTAHDLGATQIRARVGDVEAAAAFAVGTPSLRIESPAYGAGFTVGDTIAFLGSATSADGTPLTGSALVWSSSSGTLGTGNSFRSASLPVGNHTITLTATDRYGLVSADFVSIDVYPRSEREISFITILPEAASVQMGDTVHLSATAYDNDWVEIPGVTFVWSSEIPEMASVDGNGVVTGVRAGEGSVEITATVGDVNASVWVQVNPPEGLPRAEVIAPTDGSVVVLGDTVHFVGRGIGIDGEPITDDDNFWWRDTDGRWLGGGRELSVVLSTLGEHTISFYARDNSGFVASESITIFVEESTPGAPVVASVTVYPRSAPPGGVLPFGMTIPFRAVAYDSDWTELSDIVFVWTSSDSTIATVNGDGEVTGRGPGRVTIRAAVGSVSGAYEIDVGGPPIVQITAPADSATFLFGDSITFDATVNHTGWIPDSATVWRSSIDGVLDYYHPFTTAALSVGSHVITLTATDEYGVSGADTLRIEVRALSAVHRIEITPPLAGLIAPGDTLRFHARAFDELGQEVPGVVFTWMSPMGGMGQVATLDDEGLATAMTSGLAVIEATAANVRAEALLAVGAPSIGITAPQRFHPDVAPPGWGDAITFVGWGASMAGEDLTGAELVWMSSIDGPIGTGESFTTTTLSAGLHEITLTATDRFGLSATAHIDTLLVLPADLHDVEITPPTAFLARIGDAVQLGARAWTRDPVPAEVPGVNFQWWSSDPAVVEIDANGRATARGWGEAHINAITNTGLGQSIAWVGTPDFDYIRIIPLEAFTLHAPGDTLRLEARGYRTTGEVGQIIHDLPVIWTSSDPTVLTVDAHGLVTAHAPGTATIHAALGDLSATVGAEVAGAVPPIVYIVAPLDGDAFALGDAITFEGWAKDGGTELPLPASALVWTSSVDGEIGTGENFAITTLSAGVHTIYLRATTELGAGGVDSVVIEVNAVASASALVPETLSAGSQFSCGLTLEGGASCREGRNVGQLGTDNRGDRVVLSAVPGTPLRGETPAVPRILLALGDEIARARSLPGTGALGSGFLKNPHSGRESYR